CRARGGRDLRRRRPVGRPTGLARRRARRCHAWVCRSRRGSMARTRGAGRRGEGGGGGGGGEGGRGGGGGGAGGAGGGGGGGGGVSAEHAPTAISAAQT